jgi:hypothetical protein
VMWATCCVVFNKTPCAYVAAMSASSSASSACIGEETPM